MAKPFQSHTSNSTLSISAGTGSTRIALSGGGSFRVYNAGTGAAFIQFGNSSVAASVAGGFPLAPGAVEVITPPISASNSTHVAAITSTGTSIVYFTAGEGI
jgi:hypothetical protein